jgi:hypothetical protein
MWRLYYFDIRTLVIIDEKYSYKLHISWGILLKVRKDSNRLTKKVDFCIRCHPSAAV